MNETPIVGVVGLSRTFGSLMALRDVTTTVAAGEIRGVIGRNGAGKTTLANVLTGFLPVTRGRIFLGQRRIDRLPAHERARLGLRRTFQRPQVALELSVRDNVAVGGYASRNGAATLRSEAGILAETVGLAGLADRPAHTLSYGQLRLLEIARAWLGRPRVLVLDEPVAGMSPSERDRVAIVIRLIRDTGVTVIVIENDMAFVIRVCDRVTVLESGSVLTEGTPAQIRTDQRLRDGYLGVGRETRAAPAPAKVDPGGQRLLEVDALVTGYGALKVLHGVELSVARGETVAIVGANGAGKTTMLRALAGQLPVWSGHLRLEGNEIAGLRAHEIARRGIALVPEGRHVFASLTVRENLLVAATGSGRDAGLRRARLEQVETLFPVLYERASQLAGSLSGGEQQMLAIGRAIMGQPRLLLLDEPSLGLSPKMVDRVFAHLLEIQRTGVAILIVEQGERLALDLSDRVLVLRRGQLGALNVRTPYLPSLRAPETGQL